MLLLVAAVLIGTQNPVADAVPSQQADAAGKTVCYKFERLGSRVPHVACWSAAEWKRIEAEATSDKTAILRATARMDWVNH